jgi:branched-chain amino acid transport system permease protein
METFLQQLVNGLLLGSIYALVALGYTMVYGILGIINFSHGAVVMIGAMVAMSVIMALGGTGGGASPVIILLLAAVASLVVCTVLGLVIERTTYRPLRYAPKLAPLITGIGISLVIQYAAALIWGRQYMSLPDLIKPEKIVFGGAQITSTQGFIFVLDCAIMAALLWFVKTSRMGRAMRATEQNPEVAGLMGVDATRVFAFTFALGAGIGAIAGVMVMLYYGQAHYLMGAMLGLKAFTAAVLGGIGSIPGAMLGGILLGLIEALASGYIGDLTGGIFGSNYRDVFAFLVLVLVLMFKPSGLMGVHSGDRA